MNLNYVGSLAHMRMRFRSTTDVIVNNTNELFNAQSIYIPKRFAAQNIVGWSDAYLSPERPAVFVAVVDNYIGVMTGDLLAQWQPIFRQDTNGDVVIYLIVFDDEVADGWDIQNRSISYAPLTAAFQALFSFSYFKYMFDPHYDGRDVVIQPTPGLPASMDIRLSNRTRGGTFARQDVVFTNPIAAGPGDPGTAATLNVTIVNDATVVAAAPATHEIQINNIGATDITLPDGTTYIISIAGSDYEFTIAGGDVIILAGGSDTFTVSLVTGNVDANWVDTTTPSSLGGGSALVPNLAGSPTDSEIMLIPGGAQGTNGDTGDRTITLGDYALAAGLGYSVNIPADVTLAAGGTHAVTFTATANGVDAAHPGLITAGTVGISALSPALGFPASLLVTGGVQGNPVIPPGVSILLEAGTYTYNDGLRIWSITVPTGGVNLAPGGGSYTVYNVTPTTVGPANNLADGNDITNLFFGLLPAPGIVVTSANVIDGTAAGDGQTVIIPAGTYVYSDGEKLFDIVIPTPTQLRPDDITALVRIHATTVGINPNLGQGLVPDPAGNLVEMDPRAITPELPAGISVRVESTIQGRNPIGAAFQATSQFFDMSLALALLCRNNLALSWMWSLVRISYENQAPSPMSRCWVRYATRQQQLEAVRQEQKVPTGDTDPNTGLPIFDTITGLLVASRDRYYWAMLMFMECQNTTMLIHSEADYIVADILAAWFAQRNTSGTFIGNKLSLLRLSGTRIRPLGWPSWLDSSVNENDMAGHQQLREMNVGHFATISDNTPQESYLTMARGIGDTDAGIPVTMQMIAKFADYTMSMQAANMVTDRGTLTNPMLTDEDAYQEIQRLVGRTLARFAGTNGRLFNVMLMFPDFATARVSRTALSAASAWKAWYKDDLDMVEVSGGIVSE